MPRILILDDEPLIAMMVEEWLIELGCEIIGPANSVPSALGLLRSGAVDAAILDLSLGDGDSLEVADALRRLRVPFAFATGYGANGVANRFKGAPVLSKPFDFQNVKLTIGELLNGGERAARDEHLESRGTEKFIQIQDPRNGPAAR